MERVVVADCVVVLVACFVAALGVVFGGVLVAAVICVVLVVVTGACGAAVSLAPR